MKRTLASFCIAAAALLVACDDDPKADNPAEDTTETADGTVLDLDMIDPTDAPDATSPDATEDTRETDAVADATPDARPSCRVELRGGQSLDVGAGSALTLALVAHEGAVPTLAASTALPEGWSATVDGLTLRVDAGYAPVDEAVRIQLDDGCDTPGDGLAVDVVARAASWQLLASWNASTPDAPPAREYFAMWVEPHKPDALHIFGGFHYAPQQFTPAADLWRFDLGSEDGGWQELSTSAGTAPVRGGMGRATIEQSARHYFFGGLARNGNDFSLPFTLSSLDIVNDSALWTTLTPTSPPSSGSYQPAFFFDEPRRRFLAVGGQDLDGSHMKIAAYKATENTWESLPVADGTQPSGRSGFFWVHDPVTERLIVFSGDQGSNTVACNCATDTWALELAEEPMRWVELATDGFVPPARRNGAYVLDPVGRRMVIWGGTANSRTAVPGVFAFELERGQEGWYELPVSSTSVQAPPRASAQGTWDAARDRIVFGFGNTLEAIYHDLWALEL